MTPAYLERYRHRQHHPEGATVKKNRPTPRQADVLAARRAARHDAHAERRHASPLSSLLGTLPSLMRSPRRPVAEQPDSGRVVDKYGNEILTRTYQWVHRNTWGGAPYVNPERDAKSLRSGRLRAELRP